MSSLCTVCSIRILCSHFLLSNSEWLWSLNLFVLAGSKTERSRIPWRGELHFVRGQYQCIHLQSLITTMLIWSNISVVSFLLILFYLKQSVHTLHNREMIIRPLIWWVNYSLSNRCLPSPVSIRTQRIKPWFVLLFLSKLYSIREILLGVYRWLTLYIARFYNVQLSSGPRHVTLMLQK